MPAPFLSTTDYDCYVAIDGRKVPIYAASSCGTQLHGYIESIEGASFTVHAVAKGRQLNRDDRAIALDVDGSRLAFQKAPRDCRGSPNDPERMVHFLGQRCSATSIKPFYFTNLAVTEDERRASADESTLRNLGTISLKFFRIRIEGVNDAPNFAATKIAIVHENAKRRTTHQVKLGEPQTATSKEHLRYKWIDSRDSPYLTISFSYLPRGLLEARDLVPPRPVATLLPPPVAPVRAQRRSVAPPSPKLAARTIAAFLPPSSSSPITTCNSSPVVKRERQTSPEQMPPPPLPSSTPLPPRLAPEVPPRMRTPLRVRQLVQPRSSPSHQSPEAHAQAVVLSKAAPGTPLTNLRNENRQLEIELERLKQQKLREELERMRSSMGKENQVERKEVMRPVGKRERSVEKEPTATGGECDEYGMRTSKRRPFQVIIVD